MPVTLTIKNVPDDLADRLRERAADHRRSLQRELLLILEQTAALGAAEPVPGDDRAVGPARAAYKVRIVPSSGGHAESRRVSGSKSTPAGKLSLDELWRRARRLGAPSPAESADLIRRDRDARDGH
jgi:antitoxin FitA